MLALQTTRRVVVYVLEFFAVSGDERHVLDRMTHRAKSVDLARDQAKAMLRNVTIRDQKADLCLVKDQMGNTLGVVAPA
jgi:hypothetical protein